MSMTTNLGRMLNYLDWLPLIKLLDPLVMGSCKTHRKIIISPLPKSL